MSSIKNKLIVMGTLTAMVMTMAGSNLSAMAAPADLTSNPKFSHENAANLEQKAVGNLTKIIKEENEPFSIKVSEISGGEKTNVTADAAPVPNISNKYLWTTSTIPFNATGYAWSNDKDVYLSYPYDQTDKYAATTTSLLSNPTSSTAYSDAIREGYVDDQYGTIVGAHMYVHYVSSSSYNHLTTILDEGVNYYIFDKTTEALVFDSRSYSGDELGDANYISSINSANLYVGNGTKRVCDVQLKQGSYYFMFYRNELPEKGTHYAFFTGNPLPASATYSAGIAHTGSVNWNQIQGSSQTVQSPAITISAGTNSDIYAAKSITFRNVKPIGSQDYLYISKVDYSYKSPNTSFYKTVSGSGTDKQGPYVDSSPANGSIVGTYNFQFTVTWSNTLSYVGASFFALTNMDVTYLKPILL